MDLRYAAFELGEVPFRYSRLSRQQLARHAVAASGVANALAEALEECNAVTRLGIGAQAHGRASLTYSKSPGMLLMPCLGGAIQPA